MAWSGAVLGGGEVRGCGCEFYDWIDQDRSILMKQQSSKLEFFWKIVGVSYTRVPIKSKKLLRIFDGVLLSKNWDLEQFRIHLSISCFLY